MRDTRSAFQNTMQRQFIAAVERPGRRPRPRRAQRFDEEREQRIPVIRQARLDAFEHVTPFLAFRPEFRHAKRARGGLCLSLIHI